MKLPSWLDDALLISGLFTLATQLKTCARWIGRAASRSWRYLCQTATARYLRRVAFASLAVAVVWLLARQLRREVTADGHAELARYAVGASLLFIFLLVAFAQHRGEDGGPARKSAS